MAARANQVEPLFLDPAPGEKVIKVVGRDCSDLGPSSEIWIHPNGHLKPTLGVRIFPGKYNPEKLSVEDLEKVWGKATPASCIEPDTQDDRPRAKCFDFFLRSVADQKNTYRVRATADPYGLSIGRLEISGSDGLTGLYPLNPHSK